MTKYLVRVSMVATDANPNYAGETSIAYYGKGQQTVANLGTHPVNAHYEQPLNDYMIGEYGYNRLCDAKRSYFLSEDCISWDEKHNEYWTVTDRTIVSFEVEEKGVR